jgi:hypothetical protein
MFIASTATSRAHGRTVIKLTYSNCAFKHFSKCDGLATTAETSLIDCCQCWSELTEVVSR